MEKLSIEQKAKGCDDNYKVYTELINRLEDVKDAIKKQNYGIAMDVLCKPYPEFQVTTHSELKESEDERIRKFIANELICLRAAFDKGDCRYEELSNAINWLEKHEDCQKKINHAYAKGLADAQKALKKQGECHISHDDEIMIKQLTEYFTTGHGLQNTNGTVVEWLNDVKEKLEKQGKKEVKSTEEFETFVRWFVKQRTDNYTLIPSEEDIRKWADLILSHAKQELEKQGEQNNKEDADILYRFSFYSYKDEPNVIYLSGFYVNEEYRNKGIGTKILEVADEVTKSLDCHAIRLKTKKDSDAERLYQTHGYNSLSTEGKDEIWLEKQAEQKPTVETKLKIEKGKWYICISQFCNCIEGRAYKATSDSRLVDDFGTEYDMHSDAYKYFRLWTIQDAKDGDVLTWDNGRYIILFKEIKGNIVAYCSYNTNSKHFGFSSNYDTQFDCILNFTPATKEQRDLLFQKMKEAGYEWDSKKKELKKIEQSTIEEVNGEDYGIDSLYHAQRILEKTLGKVDGYQSDDGILEHKCAITAIKELYAQQQEWSEEDEKIIQDIINDIAIAQEQVYCKTRCEDEINWLKFLKERYTWKPSDEQMEAMQKALIDLCGKDEHNIITGLYYDLKKLRKE